MADARKKRIGSKEDAKTLHASLLHSAQHTFDHLRSISGNPIEALSALRFEKIGLCPITSDPLNFVEQLNQTFTILASLRAVELLLDWHPEAAGFDLSLGTCPGHDITSVNSGVVVAEVFAATHHASNDKLNKEMKRLDLVDGFAHKYVFFASPGYVAGRRSDLEKGSKIQVHVVGL